MVLAPLAQRGIGFLPPLLLQKFKKVRTRQLLRQFGGRLGPSTALRRLSNRRVRSKEAAMPSARRGIWGLASHIIPRLEQVPALSVEPPVRKVSALKVIHGVENLVRLVACETVNGVCPMQIEQTLDAMTRVAPSGNVGLWRRVHSERVSPNGKSARKIISSNDCGLLVHRKCPRGHSEYPSVADSAISFG